MNSGSLEFTSNLPHRSVSNHFIKEKTVHGLYHLVEKIHFLIAWDV